MAQHPKWMWAVAFVTMLLARVVNAQINFPVTINDPGGAYSAYYASLNSAIQAGGGQWAHYLAGSGDLQIQVNITNSVPFTTGASATSGFVRNDGMRDIFEQGAASELRTGIDPNGAAPDIVIDVNPTY